MIKVAVRNIDVADEDSVNSAIARSSIMHGTINVALHNAAVWMAGVTEAYSSDQHKRMSDVNYLGTVRLTSADVARLFGL